MKRLNASETGGVYIDTLLRSSLPVDEVLFLFTGNTDSPVFQRMVDEHKPFVDKFCKRYNLSLETVAACEHHGFFEPMYLFSGQKDHYTIHSIKNSLV